jgi:hypothetical protein
MVRRARVSRISVGRQNRVALAVVFNVVVKRVTRIAMASMATAKMAQNGRSARGSRRHLEPLDVDPQVRRRGSRVGNPPGDAIYATSSSFEQSLESSRKAHRVRVAGESDK